MSEPRQRLGVWSSLVANGLVMGVLAYAAYLNATDPDLYRAAIQEDEYLEWATFWAFLGAAALFALAAVRRRRAGVRVPWFTAGLALFCFIFAMEEISWAQRIFAYRPPTYFLEHNFQQEPNLHNVISTGLRKALLKSIIGGYGVLLAASSLVPIVRRAWRRLGIVAPPVELAPAFALALYTYETYPWKYSGEVVELMLGLAFLIVALVQWSRQATPGKGAEAAAPLGLAASAALVVVLGLATAALARNQRSLWPENVERAKSEIAALEHDFLATSDPQRRHFPTKCGLHKRVYTFAEKYGRGGLADGDFARLEEHGLPEERADFFLDPWNAPYWVRDRCDRRSGRRSIFVYSFGPNRRRDSSPWEILGDDIGSYIFVDSGGG